MQSVSGYKYIKWVDVGMPKIPPSIIDCAFFLFKSEDDAKKGVNSGATGFLVSVDSVKYPEYFNYHYYLYGVTNYHNISKGYTVIRINKNDGTTEIIPFNKKDWIFFPKNYRDDIAISPRLNLNNKIHKISFMHISMFVTNDLIKEYEIDIGDNVFMIGRFMDHNGKTVNLPSCRFGNISVMPTIIPQETGYEKGKSYIIDLHSRSGFSGSPVFVYRTPGGNLEETDVKTGKPIRLRHNFFFLLGIHWGQFPEKWETDVGPFKGITKGMSGMTLVIPAQRILDLLLVKKLRNQRKKGDIEFEKKLNKEGWPPVAELPTDSQVNPDIENPQHKEDFNSLLTAAVKKKKPDDKT
jgi:hypothetical protein